jgi:hypothetical protein
MLNNLDVTNIIVNTLNRKHSTVYYLGNKNLFSNILEQHRDANFIYEANQPFSFIIADNPLNYSQIINKLSLAYHVNTLILFMDSPPTHLKKEDRIILHKKLDNTYRVFFNDKIRSLWALPDTNETLTMSYGVPKSDIVSKEKNVCILNFENNDGINRLYQHINNYINCDLITNSNSDPIKNISFYKICISPHNIYDTILSASCGTWVFSSSLLIDKNISNISYIDNYNSIINDINNTLNNWDNLQHIIESSKNYITEHYSLNTFYSNMTDLYSKISQRVFKYET